MKKNNKTLFKSWLKINFREKKIPQKHFFLNAHTYKIPQFTLTKSSKMIFHFNPVLNWVCCCCFCEYLILYYKIYKKKFVFFSNYYFLKTFQMHRNFANKNFFKFQKVFLIQSKLRKTFFFVLKSFFKTHTH